ncbi:hypothetical protein QZH41_000878 [Actinostola sp. cb2023]|nr:hypothetical protein QZH41_000878 [Actinostola sp. cb2023]
MMFNMNLWSIGLLGLGIVTTGELFQFITFCEKYPYVLYYMLTFSCASAIGQPRLIGKAIPQNFIFMTVANFGPLSCSIITTTRKFFTILGSVVLFGNVLTVRQWTLVLCPS